MTLKPRRFTHPLLPTVAAGALLAGALAALVPAGRGAPAAPASADGGATRVTFTFAPPAGAFVQREIEVETARLGGLQESRSMFSEISLRISQEVGNSYLLYRVERAAAARDGKPSDAEMAAAMTGTEILYIARPDGVLSKVDGLRRLLQRLLPTVPKEERAALEKRLSENRIENRTRAAWFETTEILSGQTLELGRDYFFDTAWPTDEGWIQHQTLVRLGPWETTKQGRRLRVQLAYVADARAEVPAAIRLRPKVATAFEPGGVGNPAKGYSISGNASRLVDPATLLVWKDQTVRKIRNRLEVSEEMALTVSSEEKVDITLEPAPSAATAPPATN